MRISFTDKEIEEWVEFIDRVCDACCDEEVKMKHKMIRKFRNAQSRSTASKSKIRFIQNAERKKEQIKTAEIQRDILREYNK